MTAEYLIYLGIGKLIIYLGQKFIHDTKITFVDRLFACDLCLGSWVYVALALCFKITILSDTMPYVAFLSQVVAGLFSSFLMHLIHLGWKEKFEVIII